MPAVRFRPVDPRGSFVELEERVLERWRERDVVRRALAHREGAELWSFYEGPPTANGRPGSHHVLSRVFKDVYPRYQTMRGRHVPRKGGWDCHGLPVELEVEKEIGVSSKEEIERFGISEFNRRCRESVMRYVADWNRLTERIGFWLDLEEPYWTMDDDYIESVWWALRRLWDDDRLYEGHKVVPYCPRCGTALSSHEVALGYRDVSDPSVYVRMPVRLPPDTTGAADPAPERSFPIASERGAAPLEDGDALLIWTTTPWTLISNAAVAAGPDVTYARVRHGDEVLVLAEALVERVLGEQAEVLDRFTGAALAGAAYEPPFDYVTEFGPRGHTVLEADFVSTDDGTGLVHTALAFGEDDFRLGERYGLTLQNPVLANGTFDERVRAFAGQFVKDADAGIVEALRERGRLLREEAIEHAYPHCWRCETPLLYYAKASWYVATSQARERMLAANERIDWHPEHIRHGRFGRWLEGNVDWALSRDRYWGTPLPVWRCGEPGCDATECVGSVARLGELAGGVPEDLHRPFIDEVSWPCQRPACGGLMRRVEAVIDTWFDSGAMPFAQHHYPFEGRERFQAQFPADFICEAIDQTRGWFYTLHAESTLLFDEPAYRACVCLGLILDPAGQKMSKSRGNVVEPWEVIDTHGADAFRWYYLTAQQPWAGYRFSVETVGEAVRQFLLTLWNTYAFFVLYANAEDFDPLAAPQADRRPELDRWALSRLQGTVGAVREHMDAFDCTAAGRAIADYVDELSNWYVRLSRRRFWEGEPAALATLHHCLTETAKLLAPFTPFVAEELWTNLVGGEADRFDEGLDSVHLCDLPQPDAALADVALDAEMAMVRRTVELGRAARAAAGLKARQPLRGVRVVADERERATLERMRELVLGELNVHQLDFVESERQLGSYEVRPNFRALGPRFGDRMPQVAAAVAALDPESVGEALAEGRPVAISIDGTDHVLGDGDLRLTMAPLAGYEVSAEQGRAVALATELDEELVREGLAREVVHAVQGARRAAGLEITDRIHLALSGEPALIEAARAHESELARETLAVSVSYRLDGDGAQHTTVAGHDLAIAVTPAAG